MPLHHLALPVTSNETSIPFYTAALAPLSYTIIAQYPSRTTKTPNAITGLGPKAADGGHSFADFWLVEADHPNMVASKDSTGKSAVHVAFEAKDRETVRKFYEEAM